MKIALIVFVVGLGGYFIGKKASDSEPQILAQHPGEEPSILFLRVEFPDHQMDMLDSEWEYAIKRMAAVAGNYWSKETYRTFLGFQDPVISPILTLNHPSDDYIEKLNPLFDDARVVALEKGIDTEDFDHVVISYPKLLKMDKAWGTPGKIWIPGRHPDMLQFSHEIGHSFGLGHVCNTSGMNPELDKEVLPSSDRMFLMGGFPYPGLPLPLPMKYQLKVLNDEQVPVIAEPGVYRIYAGDSALLPAGKMVGCRFSFNEESYLWLGYYPSLGRLNRFERQREDLKNSVFFHLSEGLAVATLDSTPGSESHPPDDALDSGITIGSTFPVPNTSFSITPTEVGKDSSGLPWIEVSVE